MAKSTVKIPPFLRTKIYKTGQTRGADDDVIYQNRVLRNSTVLIPFEFYDEYMACVEENQGFEKGFIVLIRPSSYFSGPDMERQMEERGLELGTNAVLSYFTRNEWERYHPNNYGFTPAKQREAPLGGEFIARIASTTSKQKNRENHGFTTTAAKGAGIRVYEYASSTTIEACRIQLEYLFWSCHDAVEQCTQHEMSEKDAVTRKMLNERIAKKQDLANQDRLVENRVIDADGNTVCPLCLERLSAAGFFTRVEQAEGRSVHDLTVTQINLFHIRELQMGELNHRPYNLGWGHHHCNVVVKDSGVMATLQWMKRVLNRNQSYIED